MTQAKTHSSNRGHEPSIELVEFSVVLVAKGNNPSILNLDFLRYNEIVEPDWQIQDSPISEPAFAQVKFEGGLTLTAELYRISFTQSGDELVAEDLICPKVAKSYLDQVPHVPYSAIGINPKFFLRSSGEHLPTTKNMLRDQGNRLSFKDAEPAILKLAYAYDTRTISIDIAQVKQTNGILFQANVHRDIEGSTAQTCNNSIRSILDRWEEDLKDIRQLSKVLSGEMK